MSELAKPQKKYDPPALRVLGPVQVLTQFKIGLDSDGVWYDTSKNGGGGGGITHTS